jgi:hypothetical protein
MIIKASGRSALILAAGLLVLLASPVRAAPAGDDSAAESVNPAAAQASLRKPLRHAWHHRRSYAHRKSHAIAMKADADNKDADKKAVATEAVTDDIKTVPDIPPSIANANAQMLLAGVQISAAAAIPSGTDIPAMATDRPAGTRRDNETILVAADQLNDMDKALHESSPAPAAGVNPPPVPAATMTSENTVWDQTSLIGKVFIGFGALLTMASAARMFMA